MPRYWKPYRVVSRERDVTTPIPRSLATPQNQNRLARLEREEFLRSPDTLKLRVAPQQRFQNDDRLAGGRKAASIAAALSQYKEADFSDASTREKYRRLRQAQEAIRRDARSNATDNRYFNPYKADGFAAQTVYGTAAHVSSAATNLHKNAWVQSFLHPSKALPCIQRGIRREVLFAKRLAGKGYRTPHHRNANSGVPC